MSSENPSSPDAAAGAGINPLSEAGGDPHGNGGTAATAGEGAPLSGAPSLARFGQTLRPYQDAVVADAIGFVSEVATFDHTRKESDRRRLYACPTGTGKGTIELALLRALRLQQAYGFVDAWIITPSLEVMRGYLERCGATGVEALSEAKLAQLGEAIFVTTPQRLLNRVLAGERRPPAVMIYDEVHHATEGNEVSGTLFALAPTAAWLGFTATPYRGTPKGTQDLEKAWPDQIEVLTIPEAVHCGAWALPTFQVIGLVDDDTIALTGGDFAERAAGRAVSSRIDDLATLIRYCWEGDDPALYRREVDEGDGFTWTVVPPERRKPTAITVPDTASAGMLVEALDRVGVPARRVGQDTNAKERGRAYRECRENAGVLVSVRVLSEGVDFPWLGQLIDARPTVSPVSWLQLFGRLTRLQPYTKRYLCVCRNLERHAYLLQGLVPRESVALAQMEFDGMSKRGAGRVIGMEALNRFKPIQLPLNGGVRGQMFALYSVDPSTGHATEWAILLDPTSERAVTATRVNVAKPDGTRGYGKWTTAPLPDGLTGFATSAMRGKLSDKQAAWWKRSAARHGLDPRAVDDISMRQFAALPVLSDLRLTMHAGAAA